MNPNRIKLLVTLVLFMLAVTSAWMPSQADAWGLSSLGASGHLVATRPGVGLASGDPDAGQGAAPPPPPGMKQLRHLLGGGVGSGPALGEWVQWTGRIWATMFLKAAQ